MKTLTANEAGKMLGISREAVRDAIKRKTLKGRLRQVGPYRLYAIAEDEVERYRRENAGRPGRPHKIIENNP